ncbi:RNA polymerase specificity factor NDAI_0K00930 [Naumovozyma dairenensis CBS 421]|uniref:rRNA adenine N(6)-methyltransferase n=1 Tax=Naumovozyma dairenensis (strain ATCC 10597 / BCRC 20456 / CBS 421 / NBRC 0211 / NRRL Y-12639) TaxID=1071378 RepID=G0WHM3_NAUDC|nr:hypothetical protein NDAI_0K00930 [Naumovozyma dairenensis CBS 421]CCD27284.1 hypothetical protein NDAI_0K00930 [Naumovozyma dairenensis CBS 421]
MRVPLPPLEQIQQITQRYGARYLINPNVYDKIYDKLNLEATYKDPSKLQILDLYSGPGIQSATFYNRYSPSQCVLMESRPQFLRFIQNNYTSDSSSSPLILYPQDPYNWKSFINLIEKDKVLIPKKEPFEQVHDSFLITGNLTNHNNESLIMQWFACIGNQNWLQRFGRVKMLLWIPVSTAIKLLAPLGSKNRSKMSVIGDTLTDINLIAISNEKDLKKFDAVLLKNNHPLVFDGSDNKMMLQTVNHSNSNDSSNNSIVLLEITPKFIELDFENWDYVTKHLMVLKRTKLTDAFDSLGHGSKDYFTSKIEDKDFLKKTPADLDWKEFIHLTELFANWPFKPDIYMDFIDILQEESSA